MLVVIVIVFVDFIFVAVSSFFMSPSLILPQISCVPFIVFRCNVMCVCFFCLFVRSMATCDLLVFPIASLLNNIPKQVDKLTYFQSVCIFAIGIYINVTLMEQRASPEEKTDKFQPQVCSTSLVFSLFGLRILF